MYQSDRELESYEEWRARLKVEHRDRQIWIEVDDWLFPGPTNNGYEVGSIIYHLCLTSQRHSLYNRGRPKDNTCWCGLKPTENILMVALLLGSKL